MFLSFIKRARKTSGVSTAHTRQEHQVSKHTSGHAPTRVKKKAEDENLIGIAFNVNGQMML